MNNNAVKPPKITVAQIAEVAGVSPATVSRAINQRNIVKNATLTKIYRAMDQLGCPLPEMTAQKAPDPDDGLILINIPSMNNAFYEEVINGIRTSVRSHGYTALINEGLIDFNTVDSLLNIVRQQNVFGLIVLNSIEPALLKNLAAATCVVQCCEYNDQVDLPYVSVDDFSAAKNAVGHLIAHGHSRIAIINGPPQYKYSRERLKGYSSALTEAGLVVKPEYIIHLPEIDPTLAVSAAIQLLNLSEPPDAFFTVSDTYAAAVLQACYLSGKRIPDDVSVIGFDNLEISKFLIPPLTTVNQPKSQLGYLASELLFEKLSSPDIANKHILLDTELIIRDSTNM